MRNEVTRLLCASAISMGRQFCEIILDQVKYRYRAVAPEVGLDMNVLVQVCAFLETLAERRKKVDVRYMLSGPNISIRQVRQEAYR